MKVRPLHRKTSLVHSAMLSERVGNSVELKMEFEQPIRSFKIRGVGRLAQAQAANGATSLIASSGGNAGLAVAYAGQQLDLAVTVVVPSTTPEFMRAKLRAERAEVVEHGDSWDEAHEHALQVQRRSKNAAYVHPFDDPEIWRGHASIITEDVDSATSRGTTPPSAVIVAVGGGGLLCGVVEGMRSVGWTDVPVVAVETEGAASFALSLASDELKTLDAITSIASSLGARTVAAKALDWSRLHPVESVTVTDTMALRACRLFHEDYGEWVEPACGAALSVVYGGLPIAAAGGRVLVMVCGGAGVNAGLIDHWSHQLEE